MIVNLSLHAISTRCRDVPNEKCATIKTLRGNVLPREYLIHTSFIQKLRSRIICFHGADRSRLLFVAFGKRNDAKLREDFQTTVFTLYSLTKSSLLAVHPLVFFSKQDNLEIGYIILSSILNYQST